MYLRSGRIYQSQQQSMSKMHASVADKSVADAVPSNMTLRSGNVYKSTRKNPFDCLSHPTSNTQNMIASLQKEHKQKTYNSSNKPKPQSGQTYFRKHKRPDNFIDFAKLFIDKTDDLFTNIISPKDYPNKMDFSDHRCIHTWNHRVYFVKLISLLSGIENPNFDEIDMMLYVCKVLRKYELAEYLSTFLLNSPKKFIVTYVNNSESSPSHLLWLNRRGFNHIQHYLLKYVDRSKIVTWKERGHKCVENIL